MAHSTLPTLDALHVVDTLNSLLRCELSAVETHQSAIDKLGSDATGELFDCLHSHQLRAELLSERIIDLHGHPSTSDGPWPAFAKLFSGLPARPDRKAILTALRDGEAHCLTPYHECVVFLDAESVRLVEQDLLPEQHRTIMVMNSLFKGRP